MLLGAALALEVHGHQIRAGREQKPDDFAAVLGVAHEAGDHAEYPRGDPAVALAVAVAQVGVGLVNHHSHGVHGL